MDPYVYPGTTVLRNLAGLEDADRLSEREAQASTLRLAQLAALRIEGVYDLGHLQEFHRFVFQDVYPWAGELRSVPLAKPGSMFALPEHIENYMSDVLCHLADENHLRGLLGAVGSRCARSRLAAKLPGRQRADANSDRGSRGFTDSQPVS